MFNLKRKLLKHNKLIAWFVILSVFFSLGTQAWSEQGDDSVSRDDVSATDEADEVEEEEEAIPTDLPLRDEDELLAQMELFADTDDLELFVLESYEYIGTEDVLTEFYLYDKNGNLVVFEEGMFENTDNQIPIFDQNGDPVLNGEGEQLVESLGFFNRIEPGDRIQPAEEDDDVQNAEVADNQEGDNAEAADNDEDEADDVADDDTDDEEDANTDADNDEDGGDADEDDTAVAAVTEDDDTVTRLSYRRDVPKNVKKLKEEGIFAVRVKSSGYVWWSNPINAAHDPYAKPSQVNSLSSPIEFIAGNTNTYSTNIYRSNTQSYDGLYVNAVESIEKIDGGVRFNYNFPKAFATLVMEVVLDGESVVVTVPESGLNETRISAEQDSDLSPSAMLTLSLLNSFGAAPEGEDGYIVVADGSGAVIDFDNGKINSAQYSGQVYGRDFAISQKFAPPVMQQVYLPVYGIVRDSGNNALVAIAEKGDENATIRAAVSKQGSNLSAFNIAWFDFRTRTTDSFYIGSTFDELSIYESGKIKTGDIAVRYYPLSGKNLSYVDVADTYRDYLINIKDISAKPEANDLSFFATLNGGTVKTHSIAGFPFNLQTEATTYSQAQKIVESLKMKGVDDLVITYNDFNTESIKRKVSDSMKYSKLLGGRSDFVKLMAAVNQGGSVLYPSVGFMDYQKSGNGYSTMRHAPREVTRSRAVQQKYELAFGTPDKLQKVSAILSPYYYKRVFDSLTDSLKKENIKTISLAEATTMLYSDFSRKNPSGRAYYNRHDTVNVLTDGFKAINDAGVSILAQSANAYALPYVSYISNVPMSSSNFDIFDYDIPFYQIAVKGLIPCAVEPFNASSNLKITTLKALSIASPPHYEFIYENPGNFNDSPYNKKFYTGFDAWEEHAIGTYKMFKALVGDIAGERIVGHKRLSDNETETVFEGGRKIYINLNTLVLKIDDKEIDIDLYYEGGVA
ncbi:MAG: DUF5696 domain-containing protein [Oscillospiraceae bacterium]|nr:DUF5696 domain-containing protein [Oscillospiraceae bacterium]